VTGPRSRALRIGLIAVLVLVALVAVWFVVFPWIDRTFVNRPALEGAPAGLRGAVVLASFAPVTSEVPGL
jgi:hypothetical protein